MRIELLYDTCNKFKSAGKIGFEPMICKLTVCALTS